MFVLGQITDFSVSSHYVSRFNLHNYFFSDMSDLDLSEEDSPRDLHLLSVTAVGKVPIPPLNEDQPIQVRFWP